MLRRIPKLACLPVLMLLAGQACLAADQYELKCTLQPGDAAEVTVDVQGGGDLTLRDGDKTKKLPMSVAAAVVYDERWLNVAAASEASARQYRQAQATIKIDSGGVKTSLRPDRRLAVAVAGQSRVRLYSPAGALTQEESDLLHLDASSLLIERLLPGKHVAVGDTWAHDEKLVQALLGLDAISQADVQSALSEVNDGVATCSLAGGATGAIDGVSSEIELKGKYRFDLKAGCVVYLALMVKDKRGIGYVGPGLDGVSKMVMQIKPKLPSDDLSDAVLSDDIFEKLRSTADAQSKESGEHALSYQTTDQAVSFDYDARWRIVTEENRLTVLRFVDRGDLIAQCNLNVLPKAGKETTLAEFQEDIQKALGARFGQFARATELRTPEGYLKYRVVANGLVSDLPITWVYYHITNGQGQRVSLAMTLEQSLVERFGEEGDKLAAAIRLSAPTVPEPTASEPKAAEPKVAEQKAAQPKVAVAQKKPSNAENKAKK